ncbi:hypothetical protein LJR045_001183 [Microbacterium sp. LjRoot45]
MVATAFVAMSVGGCTNDLRAAGACGVNSQVLDGAVEIYAVDNGSESQNGSAKEQGENPSADDSTECTDPLNRCLSFEVVMREEPTLSDVASFAPTLTPLSPEPDGIGLAGLPLNVVAHAEAHTQTGELFDLPVTVRFRPVSFTFDYGDGTTRESATGGATWQQLGAAQFTATDTSHAYRQRGTYTITAVVHFAADVDFGNGWQRVPGLLGIPAGSTTVEILEARTALVERTCAENPSGIGC